MGLGHSHSRTTRLKRGRRGAILGLVGNLLIFFTSLILGLLGGSFALVASAFHTLSDALSSAVVLIGFEIAGKPADENHQFGHGDAEAVAGLIVAMLIVLIGFEVGRTAIDKIYNPSTELPNFIAVVGASLSVVVNFTVARIQGKIAREIRSPALMADTAHNITDAIASALVLVGIIISIAGYGVIDPIIGFVVALLIVKTGFDVGRQNIDMLMGMIQDPALTKELETLAKKVEGVKGVHSTKIRYSGPMASVQMHIEVEKNMKIIDADRISHKVQAKLVAENEAVTDALIHVCPCKGD